MVLRLHVRFLIIDFEEHLGDCRFEGLGMEQFGSGELFVKLLTPISFLIFTLVQVSKRDRSSIN